MNLSLFFGSNANTAKTGRLKKSMHARYRRAAFQFLETRDLMSGTPISTAALSALHSGLVSLESKSAAITNDGLVGDIPNVPLMAQSLDQGLKAADLLRDAFHPNVALSESSDQGQARMIRAGYTVEQWSPSPDKNGDLIRLTRTVDWTKQDRPLFNLGGATGFDYFGTNNDLGFTGGASSSLKQMSFTYTVGVDLVNGKPQFFFGESSHLDVVGLRGSAKASGDFSIGQLYSVQATGQVTFDLDASVTFNDHQSGHKLRILEFENLLGQIVHGDLTGSVKLAHGAFHTTMIGVANLDWGATFVATIAHNTMTRSENLQLPNFKAFVHDAVVSFFNAGAQFDPLGTTRDVLGAKVPFTSKTLGDLLHVKDKLGYLFVTSGANYAAMSYDQIAADLPKHGIQLLVTPQNGRDMMDKLVHGASIDVLSSVHKGQANLWSGDLWKAQLANVRMGIAVLSATGSLTYNVTANYDVSLGLDSRGFWVGSQSTVGVTGSLDGKLKAKADTPLGSLSASAYADLSLSLSLHLNAPTTADGRLHAVDLTPDPRRFGAAIVDRVFGDFKASIKIGVDLPIIGDIHATFNIVDAQF
jgi:hypothetical protein